MIPEKLDFFRPGHPDFDQTHRPVEAARHAPAEIYTSPELFRLEKEQIFMRDWLAVVEQLLRDRGAVIRR